MPCMHLLVLSCHTWWLKHVKCHTHTLLTDLLTARLCFISVEETKKTPIDPVMIGILVSLVLMFLIICIVLQLFSKWVNTNRANVNKSPILKEKGLSYLNINAYCPRGRVVVMYGVHYPGRQHTGSRVVLDSFFSGWLDSDSYDNPGDSTPTQLKSQIC